MASLRPLQRRFLNNVQMLHHFARPEIKARELSWRQFKKMLSYYISLSCMIPLGGNTCTNRELAWSQRILFAVWCMGIALVKALIAEPDPLSGAIGLLRPQKRSYKAASNLVTEFLDGRALSFVALVKDLTKVLCFAEKAHRESPGQVEICSMKLAVSERFARR